MHIISLTTKRIDRECIDSKPINSGGRKCIKKTNIDKIKERNN